MALVVDNSMTRAFILISGQLNVKKNAHKTDKHPFYEH